MKAEAQLTSLGCVWAGAAEDSVADTLRQMGGEPGQDWGRGLAIGQHRGQPQKPSFRPAWSRLPLVL